MSTRDIYRKIFRKSNQKIVTFANRLIDAKTCLLFRNSYLVQYPTRRRRSFGDFDSGLTSLFFVSILYHTIFQRERFEFSTLGHSTVVVINEERTSKRKCHWSLSVVLYVFIGCIMNFSMAPMFIGRCGKRGPKT